MSHAFNWEIAEVATAAEAPSDVIIQEHDGDVITQEHASADACLALASAWIVIKDRDGVETVYPEEDEFRDLRKGIVDGGLGPSATARHLPAVAAAEEGNESPRDGVEWQELHLVARGIPALDRLYRPVWSRTMQGALIGTMVGIGLKMLDTAITMFLVDPGVGIIWLLLVGCLLGSSKQPSLFWAPFGIWIIAGLNGISINLVAYLGALFSTCLVGALFGSLSGMVVGTLVGYLRANNSETAKYRQAEGNGPAIWGLLVPFAAVCTLAWLYVFAFMPWAVEQLG